MQSATELFGEQYEGLEVHEFPLRDGKGYYISHVVDNTRTVETHHEILLRFNDGTEERTTAESPKELELWTKHLA